MFDLGRRLAGIRTRLVSADGRLSGAIARRHHRADAQLGGCANRLETLSPLAVLGRGYAVCWNADRTRVVRAASDDRTNIIFGASVDEQLAGQMWVTVVATGFSMTGAPSASATRVGRPVAPSPDDLLEPPSFLQS